MTEWIAVITITLLAVISPGADFALVSRNSLLLSRRAGVLTALGISLGVLIHVGYTLLGVGLLLILCAGYSIQYLRSLAPDASIALLLLAFSIVWFMDIGAYFCGRRFGRKKLSPRISPGKSWEGVYGGLAVTTVLVFLALVIGDWPPGSYLALVCGSALAAVFSVVGDLYESRFKRYAGAKDSSNLLPGHGGVLDRIDGALAAIPMFAFAWSWL